MQNRGIYIPAFGEKKYLHWAVNLAASVKLYSPNVDIVLLHEEGLLPSEIEQTLFDGFEVIPNDFLRSGDKLTPGVAKLNLYPLLKHEENLVIDADSISITDLNGLFDMCNEKDIAFDCGWEGDENSPAWPCQWMPLDQVKRTYELPKEYKIYEVNSSFIYTKKNKTTAKFWQQAASNVKEGHRGWGTSFPDELAFNVALAQCGINPRLDKLYISWDSKVNNVVKGVSELSKRYYLLTFWGNKNPSTPRHYQNYDLLANAINKQVLGRQNPYKCLELMKSKYTQTNRGLFRAGFNKGVDQSLFIKGEYSISDTIKVQINDTAPGHYNFNGSIVEYKGEYLFCYRRDGRPAGKMSKLFICKLNKQFKQVGKSIEIKGLASNPGKGFEDGRLFVYEDKLYLTYNDNQDQWTCELVNFEPKNITKFEKMSGLPSVGSRIKNISNITPDNFLWGVLNEKIYIQNGSVKEIPGFKVDYGEIRGGTPCIKVGDLYYSAFHTVRNLNDHNLQYGMGIMAFDENGVKKYSEQPILMAEFTPMQRLFNHVFVVFPTGIVHKDGELIISFGHQDIETRIIKIKI